MGFEAYYSTIFGSYLGPSAQGFIFCPGRTRAPLNWLLIDVDVGMHRVVLGVNILNMLAILALCASIKEHNSQSL